LQCWPVQYNPETQALCDNLLWTYLLVVPDVPVEELLWYQLAQQWITMSLNVANGCEVDEALALQITEAETLLNAYCESKIFLPADEIQARIYLEAFNNYIQECADCPSFCCTGPTGPCCTGPTGPQGEPGFSYTGPTGPAGPAGIFYNTTMDTCHNVKDLNMDVIDKLRPVSYQRKTDNKNEAGFIMEEVSSVYPIGVVNRDGTPMLNDRALLALAVKEIQRSRKKIEVLSEKLEKVTKDLEVLKKK
jgi:hypothetical protein